MRDESLTLKPATWSLPNLKVLTPWPSLGLVSGKWSPWFRGLQKLPVVTAIFWTTLLRATRPIRDGLVEMIQGRTLSSPYPNRSTSLDLKVPLCIPLELVQKHRILLNLTDPFVVIQALIGINGRNFFEALICITASR